MNFDVRWLTAALVALALAGGAWRANALSARGARAAFVVGLLACAAGWSWAGLLLVFFISGSILSRLPSKHAREVEEIVEKGAERDTAQVLANGGVFAIAALGSLVSPSPLWAVAGAGALAAATADTWATELGTRLGGTPRHLLNWSLVAAGTSGGITLAGLMATAAGAGLLGICAEAWSVAPFLPVLLGGAAGAIADSLLGATLQERRHCDQCDAATERHVHRCGSHTRAAGGLAWMDNDVVNLFATLVGATIAVATIRAV